MYVEASFKAENASAELISPVLPAGYNFCFTLYTNLYGQSIGSITILLQVNNPYSFLNRK